MMLTFVVLVFLVPLTHNVLLLFLRHHFAMLPLEPANLAKLTLIVLACPERIVKPMDLAHLVHPMLTAELSMVVKRLRKQPATPEAVFALIPSPVPQTLAALARAETIAKRIQLASLALPMLTAEISMVVKLRINQLATLAPVSAVLALPTLTALEPLETIVRPMDLVLLVPRMLIVVLLMVVPNLVNLSAILG